MYKLDVEQIGDSLAVILPKEILAHLKVGEGDLIFINEIPEGYLLSSRGSHDESASRTPS